MTCAPQMTITFTIQRSLASVTLLVYTFGVPFTGATSWWNGIARLQNNAERCAASLHHIPETCICVAIVSPLPANQPSLEKRRWTVIFSDTLHINIRVYLPGIQGT